MAIVKLGRKVKTNLPGTLAYVINPANGRPVRVREL